MTKLTKKQAAEILEIDPLKIDKLVKAGKLSRERKDPSNPRSAWLYDECEVTSLIQKDAPQAEPTCCEPPATVAQPEAKKRWYQFWK